MTTLPIARPMPFISGCTSPCREYDWLEELQSQSRRVMIVDTSSISYSIVTHWPAASRLVNHLLSDESLRQTTLTPSEADVISQRAIEERVEVIILVGSSPTTIHRWLGQNPAVHINRRTQLPVLLYAK